MNDFDEELTAFSNRVLSKALTPEEEVGYTESLFESIKHVNEYGQEFWYARELQIALEYTEWRNFVKVVEKAKDAGVVTAFEYASFQNAGYKGLYNGLTAKDIKEKKNLSKNEDILDNMGYEELAANLFRATQTEAKLRREHIQGKDNANATHYEVGKEVGKEVRETIKRLGGTMPEDLPTPEKSIKQIEREQKKLSNR